jgi:hypothetical protein
VNEFSRLFARKHHVQTPELKLAVFAFAQCDQADGGPVQGGFG